MKIKVLRIIARLNIGGPAIHTILLNEGLNNNRFDSRLIAGKPEKDEGDMVYLAEEKGVRFTIIPEFGRPIRLWNDFVALWKLFRIIRKEKPDIVHTHTAKAGTLGRLAAIFGRVPIRLHSFHGNIFSSYFGKTHTQFFIFIERLLAAFTDKIIVVTKRQQDEICHLYRIVSPQKCPIVKLGIDTEHFLDCEKFKGGLRNELGLSADQVLVGTVGRLTKIKNHKMFLDIIKILQQYEEVCNVRFLIIGDGELRGELEEYAAKLGIKNFMIFTGWRQDLAKIYADLDIVTLTSLNEGTPLSIIEAMLCARPVVATAVGGVPDVIINGKTGILVSQNDANMFAKVLVDLIEDKGLRIELGNNAREFAKNNFSKNRLINDIENLYEDLIIKKGRRP